MNQHHDPTTASAILRTVAPRKEQRKVIAETIIE